MLAAGCAEPVRTVSRIDGIGGVMATLRTLGGTLVLVVDAEDDVVGGQAARDLLGEAFVADAAWVAVPAGRLDPAFFDLRSGVAGDLLQLSVNYRARLAVIGELPEPAASSNAFAALVRESNAGSQHWFLPSLEALARRLEAGGRTGA
jgi:hypothetical protein